MTPASAHQSATSLSFDVVVIGAGAAGLFCAAMTGQRGASVLLIDHADKVAEKIRISGGGRCNFTNRDTSASNFVSSNPQFARSALSRYTASDFLALVQGHNIPWHEKHKGQLFCDESSEDIISMLLRECDKGRVTRWQPSHVSSVEPLPDQPGGRGFELSTDRGVVRCKRLVVATGGLSIPKIGATDFGYRLARQFGHRIVTARPALVPLMFDPVQWSPFAGMAGLSVEVDMQAGGGNEDVQGHFVEDLLFTHRGLSGPAVLQISTYWKPGTDLHVNLAPTLDLEAALLAAKRTSRKKLSNELATLLPSRLAETWLATTSDIGGRFIAEIGDKTLRELAASLHHWAVRPSNTEGYRKAEVTAGGVDTRELSSQSMESSLQPGLHFIGEVVDVTGWLGGYNFQWAWSSAMACAIGCTAPSPAPPPRVAANNADSVRKTIPGL